MQMCVSAKTFFQNTMFGFMALMANRQFLKNSSAEIVVFVAFAKHSSNLNARQSGLLRGIDLNDSSVKTMKMCVSAKTFLQNAIFGFMALMANRQFLKNSSAEIVVFVAFAKHSSNLNARHSEVFRGIDLNDSSMKTLKQHLN
jgi:stage V sporulation protein SpoVS